MQTKKRQNRLKQIAKTKSFTNQKKKQNLFQVAKMQKIFQNEIEKIKKEINLLQDKLEQSKKRQSLLQNGLKQIPKIQNQPRDELEQIAEMRRIKNYAKMSKEGLIIACLKSKHSLAELFNNNFDNDRIKGIKKILNELRDILTKEYRKKIKKKLYEIENTKILSKLQKEEINEYLTELERILNKKKKIAIMIVMILIIME